MKTDIAIIGGTGLNQLDGVERIGAQHVETRYGAVSSPLQLLAAQGKSFLFLARHGQPHRLPPHRINYRANIAALHAAGVKTIIAVNAVGGIHAAMSTGAIAIPRQLLDYTWGRAHTFHDEDSLDHIDFTEPYTPSLREQILRSAASARIDVVDFGVYAVVQGPRLETAAEIDRLERDGADLVGMTGMPEAALARELGLQYASICLVVNPAAGRAPGEITMADMQRVIDQGMGQVRTLLRQVIADLGLL